MNDNTNPKRAMKRLVVIENNRVQFAKYLCLSKKMSKWFYH